MPDEQVLITLESDHGQSIPCRLLDIIEFMNFEYALLLELADESLVIMRMRVKNGETVFQTIESDEEFNRVVQHVRMLAKI